MNPQKAARSRHATRKDGRRRNEDGGGAESDVRDETIAMTEEILKIESEIDARVKALYGL